MKAEERFPGLRALKDNEHYPLIRQSAIDAYKNPRRFTEISLLWGEDITPSVHGMHGMIQGIITLCQQEGRHAVIVMPPEHCKTVQVSRRMAWEIGHHPNLRVGLVSEDRDLSVRNMISIRKTLTAPMTHLIFPKMVPDQTRSVSRGEWSVDRLYLEGQQYPSVERFTRDGANEGVRLDLIWLDDVVTRKCHRSAAEREKAQSAIFHTWTQRITDNGICIFTNNVWHRADPIHEMLDSDAFAVLWLGYEMTLERMYYRIHHPPKGWLWELEGHMPLWNRWGREKLEKKYRENRIAFKRLFGGNAVVAEEGKFPPLEDWRRWEALPAPGQGERLYGFLDPSGGKEASKDCFAAMHVVLATADQRILLIDSWVRRASVNDQINIVFDMHKKWKRKGYAGLDYVYVEALAKEQKWVSEPYYAEREMRRLKGDPDWRLAVVFKHPWESKESRIERLPTGIENGWLEFPADLEERMKDESGDWRLLVEQCQDYPFSDYVDAPDSLSGVFDLAKTLGAAGQSADLRDEEGEFRPLTRLERTIMEQAKEPPVALMERRLAKVVDLRPQRGPNERLARLGKRHGPRERIYGI